MEKNKEVETKTYELLKILSSTTSVEDRKKIVELIFNLNYSFAVMVANLNSIDGSVLLDKDDFVQEASLALVKAINTYKLDSGASFKTYAVRVIRNEIYSKYKKSKPNLLYKKHTAIKKLAADGVESPTPEQIVEAMKINPYLYNTTLYSLSLDSPIEIKGNEQPISIIDIIDSGVDVIQNLIIKEEQEVIQKWLGSLSEMEQMILKKYYWEKYTIKRIAEESGLSYIKVRNTIMNALKKFRKDKLYNWDDSNRDK